MTDTMERSEATVESTSVSDTAGDLAGRSIAKVGVGAVAMVVTMAYEPAGLFRAAGTDLPEGLAVRRLPVVAGQEIGIGIELYAGI
jgi:hypothetical protein